MRLTPKKDWQVVEVAVYTDEPERRKLVESDLSRRQAVRRAREWQAASARSKIFVQTYVAANNVEHKPFPVVTYLVEEKD